MPPPKTGPRLTAEQIDLIKRWIAEGAQWKGHWAYLPPTRPAVPVVPEPSAPANEIDRFIRARLALEHLSPAPPAESRTLIRRLSFDLIGLPPTPEEVEAFVNDSSPKAYERLVDRLLASPHFGERMAIFWLDLVRFADTTGYHGDNHVDLYLFRDYVIRAFNANKPFDRFTIEQLAGDLLDDATDETRIASGYNRLLQTTQEGERQAKEYMAKYSADRVRNVSTVWLGATIGCAECHDHKFDPYKTREFYSLAAFFADIKETAVGVQEPTRFPSPAQAESLRSIEQEIARLKATKRSGEPEKQKLAELEKRQKALAPADSDIARLRRRSPPRTIRVLPRGNWLDETGPVVTPGGARLSAALLRGQGSPATRLDLARWLVDRENPLVARVMVNRLWKLVFGQGLVTTPDDFGSQGAWPTHPELLDWLACEFVDSGWDVKAMLKRMVMTETYRQVVGRLPRRCASATRPTAGCRIKTGTGSTPSWFATEHSPSAACSPARSAARASSPINPRATGSFSISRSATTRPIRARTSIAAASTPTGSARFCTPACSPSTPRPARNAWSSDRGRTRRSRRSSS